MTKGKAGLLAAVIAFAGALLPTIIALKMLADNNNNGELYDMITGQWDVGYALSFSAMFFVPSFLMIFAITYGLARRWGEPADEP